MFAPSPVLPSKELQMLYLLFFRAVFARGEQRRQETVVSGASLPNFASMYLVLVFTGLSVKWSNRGLLSIALWRGEAESAWGKT